MVSDILEALLDALLDSLRILPFLFAAYLLIEYIEHKASAKLTGRLTSLGKYGPLAGLVSWVLPHFSITAAHLYAGKVISGGMLFSILISTSEDALPVLMSSPGGFGAAWKLVLIKALIGVAGGVLLNAVFRDDISQSSHREAHDHMHEHCIDDECGHGILRPALRHTLKSILFVAVSLAVIGALIAVIGQDAIGSVLSRGFLVQPLIAALVGFIPSCAASIILTEFYLSGALSFGSYTAGLITAAGISWVVLFRSSRSRKKCLALALASLVAALIAGYVIQLF